MAMRSAVGPGEDATLFVGGPARLQKTLRLWLILWLILYILDHLPSALRARVVLLFSRLAVGKGRPGRYVLTVASIFKWCHQANRWQSNQKWPFTK